MNSDSMSARQRGQLIQRKPLYLVGFKRELAAYHGTEDMVAFKRGVEATCARHTRDSTQKMPLGWPVFGHLSDGYGLMSAVECRML